MSFDRSLLDIVCCPVTRLPLEMVPEATLLELNDRIEERNLRSCGGSTIDQPLSQALMTRDGRLAYPVRDDIPILLEEQGILLAQIKEV